MGSCRKNKQRCSARKPEAVLLLVLCIKAKQDSIFLWQIGSIELLYAHDVFNPFLDGDIL